MKKQYDLHIRCPRCMHKLVVGEEDAGSLLACPDCGCEFEIPAEEGGGGGGGVVVSSGSTLHAGMSASEKVQRRMEEQAKKKVTIVFRFLAWFCLCASLLVVFLSPWTIAQVWPGLGVSVFFAIILLFRKSLVNGIFVVGICILSSMLLSLLYEPPPEKIKKKVQHVQLFENAGQPPRRPTALPEKKRTAEQKAEEESKEKDMAAPSDSGEKQVAVVTESASEPDSYDAFQYETDEEPQSVAEEEEEPAPPVEKQVPDMPFVLYGDCGKAFPFTQENWMGNHKAIYQDTCCEENPQSGETCIQIKFTDTGTWGGGAWLAPDGNWGDHPPLYDFSNATKLTFWARGEEGGEEVEFSVGLVSIDKQYRDSVYKTTGKIVLPKDWAQYEINLQGKDLSSVLTAFSWALPIQRKRSTFYIDNVKFE